MKIIIIGAGPAGYNLALELAKNSIDVILIEENNIGGVCLNEGCIPTKSLLYQTKFFNKNNSDWEGILNNKQHIVDELSNGINTLLQIYNVKLIKGRAYFLDKNTIIVNGNKYTFDKAVIATGSSPVIPDFAQYSSTCMDSSDILSMNLLPKSVCIIGGGVIGCEMANLLTNIGIKITLIEAASNILSGFEKKHISLLTSIMLKKGISIHTNANVTEVRDTGFTSNVVFIENGENKYCACDKVLVATGRKANIRDLNLENIGIKIENGLISVDDNCKTAVENIYAIGDCASHIKLAYWGTMQAKKLAKHIVDNSPILLPKEIPLCVFTQPEIAKIGYTEEQLVGRNIKTAELPFSANGKAHCIEETEGYVKLIIDAESHNLLGGHIVGPLATELIGILVPLVINNCHISLLTNSVFSHPTLSETISEVAELLLDDSLNNQL